MGVAVKKLNIEGEEVGSVELADEWLQTDVNAQLIKDYLVALRANKRQWSANTQTRAEVNHSTKKPHAQKGTGRARQGFLGAPQYRGGGRVGGPRPKFDQHVRINQKERRAAIRYLVAEKIKSGHLFILEMPNMSEPKTKTVTNFLKKGGIGAKRTLFLAEGAATASKKGEEALSPREKYAVFCKSLRNIENSTFKLLPNMSGYDAALYGDLVVMEPALDALMVLLKE